MRVERKYRGHNLNEAFFPVERCEMTYSIPGGGSGKVSGYKALVNPDNGQVLSTVSDRYKVITNDDAYRIVKPIVAGFFGGGGIGDFECFNIHMPRSKASCRIDLTRKESISCSFEPVTGDKYVGFVRIVNSYNRTARLQLQIGFCRWICLNGCIFGANSYTIAIEHTDRMLADPNFAQKVVALALESVGDLAVAEKNFANALAPLTRVQMTEPQMRALFCKVYGIGLTESSVKDLTEKKLENLIEVNRRLASLTASYREEFGSTAYAAFNVMSDFASYPRGGQQHAVYTPSYQGRVGQWLQEFSSVASGNAFDLDEYIGDDNARSQVLLGTLASGD